MQNMPRQINIVTRPRASLRVFLALLPLGAAVLLAGCGYTSKPPFRTDVRTVAVPIFRNDTFAYPGIEFDLTEAVKKEIEAHSPYKVTGTDTADTILRGTITKVAQTVLAETNTGGLPQELEVQYIVDFQWSNARTGETLADAKGVTETGRYVPTQPVGETLSIGGLQQKVLSAKMYQSGKAVKFDQSDFRARFTGLPANAPDPLVTTLAVEMDGEPTQDMNAIRVNRKRENV